MRGISFHVFACFASRAIPTGFGDCFETVSRGLRTCSGGLREVSGGLREFSGGLREGFGFVSGLFGIWLLTLCTILDLKNLQKRCEGY